MAKVSHKQRIIDLIELNKSDVEIKKTIYNEYNIVVKLSDIEAKRNTNYIIEFKENKNQEIDDKIKLVKEILDDNYYNPLTKKEIVNKIHAKHQVYLTQIEIKEILWTRLRNEIVYDKDEWTYRLKNKIKNEIDEIEKPTLNQYLKNNISDIIKELYGKIQFSQTVNFLEEFLYNEVNDIHDFDAHNELCFEKLQKIVLQNYNLLKKMYNIIQNIPNIVSLKNEVIENDDDINETDLNNFTNTFNSLFEVDEEKIRIKNNFFFNQTKDELEFLYEAYDKYISVINKKTDSTNKENSSSTKDYVLHNVNFDLEVLIDNSNFKIYKKKEFFKPIFYYNFNSSNGDNEIIINLSHELYKPAYEEFIIKIACSMYFTKSSMTSNVIDIYINRLLSNLALIHE